VEKKSKLMVEVMYVSKFQTEMSDRNMRHHRTCCAEIIAPSSFAKLEMFYSDVRPRISQKPRHWTNKRWKELVRRPKQSGPIHGVSAVHPFAFLKLRAHARQHGVDDVGLKHLQGCTPIRATFALTPMLHLVQPPPAIEHL
jgi:hypothetical protein